MHEGSTMSENKNNETHKIPGPHNQGTSDAEDSDVEWDPMLCHDSIRPNWEKEGQEEGESEDEDMALLTEGWDCDNESEKHGVKMLKLSISNRDDPLDEDWIPLDLRSKYLWNRKRRQSGML